MLKNVTPLSEAPTIPKATTNQGACRFAVKNGIQSRPDRFADVHAAMPSNGGVAQRNEENDRGCHVVICTLVTSLYA